jgi:endo-alpha-1,4-polygalactosaminidase (GH114 family)
MRLSRILLLTFCASAFAAPAAWGAPHGETASVDQRLAAVDTWAFAIGGGNLSGDLAARYAGFDLVVVDGEEVTQAQVRKFHAAGAIVLAYVSVGTIERGRAWYRRAKRYRLDYWGDWGEWYANVARRGFRDLIARRVAPGMLRKGVDGLFLDNVDMIEQHRSQRRGMRALVTRLSRAVHTRGGYLFAQNGASVLSPMLGRLDGWNREDVGFTYDFDHRRYLRSSAAELRTAQSELRLVRARGLLTLSTSYTHGSSADRDASVAFACAAGALPFVSNISLTRVGAPTACPPFS